MASPMTSDTGSEPHGIAGCRRLASLSVGASLPCCSVASSDGMEAAMERHRKMQEDIAEDMISIARSLRHNSLAAKEIIIGDNQVGMPVC